MKSISKKLSILVLSAVLVLTALVPGYAGTVSVLLGDSDNDGKITSSDARNALRLSVGLDELTDELKKICDVNSDSAVTSADARTLLRVSVNLDSLNGKKVSVYRETKDSSIYNYSAPAAPVVSAGKDTFTITVYGYGHGIGMSQWGAVIMADAGYTYKDILAQYFKNTTVKVDKDNSGTLTYNGKEYPANEIVACITNMEIGGVANDDDAIKAQAVAIYTLFKLYGKNSNSNNVGVASSSYSSCSEKLKTAVNSVIGEYVAFNSDGSPALTVYSAIHAGKSMDCSYSWGGSYPVSADSPFEYKLAKQTLVVRHFTSGEQIEVVDENGKTVYVKTVSGQVTDNRTTRQPAYFTVVEIFPSSMIKKKILAYDSSIELSDNPAEWFDIITHNASIDANRGYVKNIRVGDLTLSGVGELSSALKLNLRSGCYTIEYNK